MSFCKEQKVEILSCDIKSMCCKRAILYGILCSTAVINKNKIMLSLDSNETAEFVCEIINEVYDKDPLMGRTPNGGRRVLVSFESKGAEKVISLFRKSGEVQLKCGNCQSAFLKGIFLSIGRVSDPTKQYCLEFSLKTDVKDALENYFSNLGLTPRFSAKPKESLIYFKNSNDIEDFFAMAGMNQAVFAFMNEKIQGDIRNNANRIANCEMNNIEKSVSASMEQIALIEELVDRGLLSQLPEVLEHTARMRMEHKELSLARLASIITPPISKPGLSHRLKRITDIAKALLSGDQK